MHKIVKKSIAAMLAVLLFACSFASCQDETSNEGEGITRGPNSIEAPETVPTSTTEPVPTETMPAETTAAAVTTTKPTTPAGTTQSSQNVANIASQSGASLALVSSLVNAFGFNYDAREGVFYTEIDSWQRSANYIKHYDSLAVFGNMRFVTNRIDFTYDGLDWRLQFWKGQYGAFGGAEIGIYNKIPGQTDELYYCADDDHLMSMSYTMYQTPADYRSGTTYFSRPWQKHWWLTGFKIGTVVPTDLVMSARLRTFDSAMALAMENGLKAAGFVPGDARTRMDSYRRSGFDFYILWYSAGELNYTP